MKKGHDSFRKISEVIRVEGSGCSELELNQICDQVESIRVNAMMADAEDIPQKPRRAVAEESKRKPKPETAAVAPKSKPKSEKPKPTKAEVAAKKLASEPTKRAAAAKKSSLYVIGDKVEVFVEDMWYPGEVAKNQIVGGKIYVIQNDGDKKKLSPERVRYKSKARRIK